MNSDNDSAIVRKLSPRRALQATRLMGQLQERLRYLHYSLRTEQAYQYWVRWFVRFHGMRHPREMGKVEVEAFLTMLATERQVSVSTHRQALSALLFLYKEVLGQQLPWLAELGRPPARKRIPSVLGITEVERVLGFVDGLPGLLARLLYGTGMRLREGLALRVKDIDFNRRVIVVREGKGAKDRVVMLPRSLAEPLRDQLRQARCFWEADRAAQRSGVWLPAALESKYPRAGLTWAWHWVFPSPALSVDPHTGVERRHHLHEERLARALKRAVVTRAAHDGAGGALRTGCVGAASPLISSVAADAAARSCALPPSASPATRTASGAARGAPRRPSGRDARRCSWPRLLPEMP